MKKIIMVIGIMALLMVLLMVASCSSQITPKVENTEVVNSNNQDSQGSQDSQTDTIKLTVKEQSEGKEAINNKEANQESDAKTVFEELVAKGEKTSFQVNYDSVNVYDGQTQEMKSKWYLKGDKFRMDSEGVAQGVAFKSSMITSKDQAILCSYERFWTCYDLGMDSKDALEQQEGQAEMIDSEDLDLNTIVTIAPDRKIAGTTAKCFKLLVNAFSSEYCYSKEGIPLYFDTSGEGVSMKQVATSYSTTVSDDNFNPPATVQDTDALIAKMGLPADMGE